jgi:hypothetical protein
MHVNPKLYTKCPSHALNSITKSVLVIWQVNNQALVVLSLYVNDLVIVSCDFQYLEHCKTIKLNEKFAMIDKGTFHIVL